MPSTDSIFTVYAIAGGNPNQVRLLLHISDAEEPGDYELYRSAVLVKQSSMFKSEFFVNKWLTSLAEGPDKVFYAVAMDGSVFSNPSGLWTEKLIDSSYSFNSIRRIGRHMFAVGMDGLFMRVAADHIEKIGSGTSDDLIELAGNRERNIHIIGGQGKIWHYDDNKVTNIDSPTDRTASRIAVTADDTFFICGENGLLLRGAGSQWDVISETDADLFSVAVFGDRVFFAASELGIVTLDDNRLRSFKADWFADGVFAAGGSLFSFSGSEVAEFDGRDWHKVAIDFSTLPG